MRNIEILLTASVKHVFMENIKVKNQKKKVNVRGQITFSCKLCRCRLICGVSDRDWVVISTVDGPHVSFQDFIAGEEEIKRGVVSVQIGGGHTNRDMGRERGQVVKGGQRTEGQDRPLLVSLSFIFYSFPFLTSNILLPSFLPSFIPLTLFSSNTVHLSASVCL